MTNYIMKTVQADGSSYGGFMWQLEVGAKVVAPDWDPTPECGGGLHGLLNGCGNGGLLDWGESAVWIVAKVPKSAQVVDLGGKVKVDRCKVVHVGDQVSATSFLQERVGNYGTATAGYYGIATAGYSGTAIAGNYGTATAGDYGAATAGGSGIATAGYSGTAIAGEYGTATAGDYGTATAGDYGTATAGDSGTATAGDSGTATAGYGGTATAGDYGTATAGDHGTATAGDHGTATAGYDGEIHIRWWDGERSRTAVGYVGENGIEPNVAYIVKDGKLVKR